MLAMRVLMLILTNRSRRYYCSTHRVRARTLLMLLPLVEPEPEPEPEPDMLDVTLGWLQTHNPFCFLFSRVRLNLIEARITSIDDLFRQSTVLAYRYSCTFLPPSSRTKRSDLLVYQSGYEKLDMIAPSSLKEAKLTIIADLPHSLAHTIISQWKPSLTGTSAMRVFHMSWRQHHHLDHVCAGFKNSHLRAHLIPFPVRSDEAG